MNNMNKVFLGTVIGAVAISSSVAHANEKVETRCATYKAYVTASSLNIRSSAEIKSNNKIGSLFQGQEVEIIGEQNGWAKIAFGPKGTKVGYVSGDYLSATKANTADKSIKKIAYVTTNNLNMRRIGNPSGTVLGKLFIGDQIELTGKTVESGGYKWHQAKAITRANGDFSRREFYVAGNFISQNPVSKPGTEKPDTKPEVSNPGTEKPNTNPGTEKPDTKPEESLTLKPVVNENSVAVVSSGKVTNLEGKTLFKLNKGDKVTLAGENAGIDHDRILLNDGSVGVIHKSMVDANFHLHDEFVYGRECNLINLGISNELVEYTSTRDLVGYDSDCDYFSQSITIPKGAELDIALDSYNPVTKRIDVGFKYAVTADETVQGQASVPVYQFK